VKAWVRGVVRTHSRSHQNRPVLAQREGGAVVVNQHHTSPLAGKERETMKRISISTVVLLLVWNGAGLHKLYGLGTLTLLQAGCIAVGVIFADMLEDLAKILKGLSSTSGTR
jgi:hypothetical protein